MVTCVQHLDRHRGDPGAVLRRGLHPFRERSPRDVPQAPNRQVQSCCSVTSKDHGRARLVAQATSSATHRRAWARGHAPDHAPDRSRHSSGPAG